MKHTITSHNIEINQKEKSEIGSKLQKIDRVLPVTDKEHEVFVEITHNTKHHNKGLIYKASIRFETAGKLHHTEADGTTTKKAFDKAFISFQQEVSSHYKKKNTLFIKGAQKIKKLFRKA